MDNTSRYRLFSERLLDRLDPHKPHDHDALTAQLLCGRWLALRRIRHNYAPAEFAALVGFEELTLFWLETGVGDALPIAPEATAAYAALLADEPAGQALVQRAIAIAAGVEPADGATLAVILAELP